MRLTKLIAVTVRELCTLKLDLAKCVNTRAKHLWRGRMQQAAVQQECLSKGSMPVIPVTACSRISGLYSICVWFFFCFGLFNSSKSKSFPFQFVSRVSYGRFTLTTFLSASVFLLSIRCLSHATDMLLCLQMCQSTQIWTKCFTSLRAWWSRILILCHPDHVDFTLLCDLTKNEWVNKIK